MRFRLHNTHGQYLALSEGFTCFCVKFCIRAIVYCIPMYFLLETTARKNRPKDDQLEFQRGIFNFGFVISTLVFLSLFVSKNFIFRPICLCKYNVQSEPMAAVRSSRGSLECTQPACERMQAACCALTTWFVLQNARPFSAILTIVTAYRIDNFSFGSSTYTGRTR